jgi:hypothetical protein
MLSIKLTVKTVCHRGSKVSSDEDTTFDAPVPTVLPFDRTGGPVLILN